MVLAYLLVGRDTWRPRLPGRALGSEGDPGREPQLLVPEQPLPVP